MRFQEHLPDAGTWDMKGRTLGSKIDNVFGRTTFEWLPALFTH
jgi:hypothetical protein